MPASGRKPKPPGEAINRNKPAFEWTEVEDKPFDGGPRLPRKRCNGADWPERTQQKWRVWRRLPHACTWSPGDWEFILDTLELVADYHESRSVRLATEIRNREKVIGTTADYRRDLRIRYVEPKKPVLAAVVNVDDYLQDL